MAFPGWRFLFRGTTRTSIRTVSPLDASEREDLNGCVAGCYERVQDVQVLGGRGTERGFRCAVTADCVGGNRYHIKSLRVADGQDSMEIRADHGTMSVVQAGSSRRTSSTCSAAAPETF